VVDEADGFGRADGEDALGDGVACGSEEQAATSSNAAMAACRPADGRGDTVELRLIELLRARRAVALGLTDASG